MERVRTQQTHLDDKVFVLVGCTSIELIERSTYEPARADRRRQVVQFNRTVAAWQYAARLMASSAGRDTWRGGTWSCRHDVPEAANLDLSQNPAESSMR